MIHSLILLGIFLTKVDFKNQSDILPSVNLSYVFQKMLHFFPGLTSNCNVQHDSEILFYFGLLIHSQKGLYCLSVVS